MTTSWTHRSGVLWLRAAAFYVGLGACTAVMAPGCVLLWPAPYRLRYRLVVAWTRFNLWWLKVCCGLDCSFEGLERIPSRPTIVMCKHQSAWETIAINMLFQPQVWVLKRELLLIPILGWGLAALRPIAIDRNAGAASARQIVGQGADRLQRGCWVVIFPEGTRVAAGTRSRYHVGAARLASSTGYSVVPVAHNAGDYWPRRAFRKRPGTIRMIVGPTIDTTEKRAKQITREAEAWIEQTVAELRADDGLDTSYYLAENSTAQTHVQATQNR